MYELPNSVDTPELKDRGLYVSYPVGCLLPVYIVVKAYVSILNKDITATGIIKIIQWYSLLIHAIEACCLFFICWLFLKKKMDTIIATIVSFFSILLLYNLNFSNYYHFFVYFADQSVLWIFALSVLLELLRHEIKNTRNSIVIEILLFFVNLLGLITDWFFYFYMFIIFIKRLVLKEFGCFNVISTYFKIIFFCLPVFISASLFLYQILSVDTFSSLIEKFKFRTSDTSTFSGFWLIYVIKYFIRGYGIITTTIFVMSIIFYFYKLTLSIKRKKIDLFAYIYTLLLIPCIFQVSFFRNHSAIHEFSVLKFELAISFFLVTFPFELFNFYDYVINLHLSIKNKNKIFKIPIIVFFVAVVSLFCIFSHMPISIGDDSNYDKEYFIHRNTLYSDIIFSFDYEISSNPPHNLAHSRKIVRKITQFDEIDNYAKHNNFTNVRYLIFAPDIDRQHQFENLNKVAEENGMFLYEYKVYP